MRYVAAALVAVGALALVWGLANDPPGRLPTQSAGLLIGLVYEGVKL